MRLLERGDLLAPGPLPLLLLPSPLPVVVLVLVLVLRALMMMTVVVKMVIANLFLYPADEAPLDLRPSRMSHRLSRSATGSRCTPLSFCAMERSLAASRSLPWTLGETIDRIQSAQSADNRQSPTPGQLHGFNVDADPRCCCSRSYAGYARPRNILW